MKASLSLSPLITGSFFFTPPFLGSGNFCCPLGSRGDSCQGHSRDFRGSEQDLGDITNPGYGGVEDDFGVLVNPSYGGAEDIYFEFRFERTEDSSTKPRGGRPRDP
jgi:hypothetical protein